MTSAQIIRMLKNPREIYDLLIGLFKAENLAINQEKTLANVEYFDRLHMGTAFSQVFFKGGEATLPRTNLASFMKPESEHTLIYAIRIMIGVDPSVTVEAVDPDPPLSPAAVKALAAASVCNPTQWVNLNTVSDPALSAAVLTININGTIVLNSYPLAAFYADVESGDDYSVISLEVPIVWGGQSRLFATIETQGKEFSDQCLQLSFVGIGLV